MRDIWFISDTHFGHENILEFLRHDGTKLRDFKNLGEMNDLIFTNWAETVKPQDKIYHLGDLAFGQAGNLVMKAMRGLPGHKRLVMGNHDKYKAAEYAQVFEKLLGVSRLDNLWLSHIPVHPHSIVERRVLGNAHGHLHDHILDDGRYFCCSVEQTNYKPVHFETIRDSLRRWQAYEAAAKELFPG